MAYIPPPLTAALVWKTGAPPAPGWYPAWLSPIGIYAAPSQADLLRYWSGACWSFPIGGSRDAPHVEREFRDSPEPPMGKRGFPQNSHAPQARPWAAACDIVWADPWWHTPESAP